MDKLGEIMRRQQEMMNETFRMDQMQRGQRQRGQDPASRQGEDQDRPARPGTSDSRAKPMTPQEFADAHEAASRKGRASCAATLGDLSKGLEGLGIKPGEGFGEAGEAMGEAEAGARRRSQGDAAVGQQGRALEALRQAAPRT